MRVGRVIRTGAPADQQFAEDLRMPIGRHRHAYVRPGKPDPWRRATQSARREDARARGGASRSGGTRGSTARADRPAAYLTARSTTNRCGVVLRELPMVRPHQQVRVDEDRGRRIRCHGRGHRARRRRRSRRPADGPCRTSADRMDREAVLPDPRASRRAALRSQRARASGARTRASSPSCAATSSSRFNVVRITSHHTSRQYRCLAT